MIWSQIYPQKQTDLVLNGLLDICTGNEWIFGWFIFEVMLGHSAKLVATRPYQDYHRDLKEFGQLKIIKENRQGILEFVIKGRGKIHCLAMDF